jgi:hypothetical protein
MEKKEWEERIVIEDGGREGGEARGLAVKMGRERKGKEKLKNEKRKEGILNVE